MTTELELSEVKKCRHCNMPQTGVFLTLSDGKRYPWVDLCLPNQVHEFQ